MTHVVRSRYVRKHLASLPTRNRFPFLMAGQLRFPPKDYSPRLRALAPFVYEYILQLTFGVARAEELARIPKRDAQKLAPKPFDEVFDNIPDDARENSLALSILGPAGIALTLAALIAAAICIDIQRLESKVRGVSPTPPNEERTITDTFTPDMRSNDQEPQSRSAAPAINEPKIDNVPQSQQRERTQPKIFDGRPDEYLQERFRRERLLKGFQQ
jgi:hypothetical protein